MASQSGLTCTEMAIDHDYESLLIEWLGRTSKFFNYKDYNGSVDQARETALIWVMEEMER